jgi:cell division protein FtsW
MLYSASWYESFANSNGRTDMLFLQGHLKRMLVGIFFLFGFLFLDYRRLKEVASYMIAGAIFLLIMTKAASIINGMGWSKPARWLYIGPFTIQTSDIARMAVIIYMAYYVDKKREKLKDFQTGLLPPLGILTIIMGLIVIQPDFSTAAMIGVIGIIILFIGGVRLSQLSLAGAASLLVGIPVLMAKQYRRDRIFYYLGLTEGQSVSYQPNQSLISLGNGGVFGAGLGNSIEKNHFLPTPHTDFIFSIIGEELGLILGTIPILTLFLLIFFRGLKIARECTDPFGVFLAVGISFNLILYAFVNAAVVTGLFPVTGLPMPLVSYGGSGMVINMAMIGILLNISQARRSVGGNRGWSPALYG